ncbi:MAG: G8 domain-containing protein, partial [Bacteroidota bacterium]
KYVATGAPVAQSFEIGDVSSYTPVSVTFASVTTAGTLTAKTTSGDHSNIATSNIDPNSTANRYWTLSNTGIVFTTYDVTFTFVSGDVDLGSDPLQFVVGAFTGSWSYPTVGTRTATTTQATGVTIFGDFQLGQQFGGTYTSTGAGGNWNSISTWGGGQVPGLNADVVIATGTTVTIDVSTANLRSMTIQTGGILNGGGSFTLSFGADGGTDFDNSGTFTANNVTVRLNKNSQWAGSGTFNVKNIDFNSKTLTLAFSSANTIYLSGTGDPIINPGTLVPRTNSTIEYNGTSGQSISSSSTVNFHHLRITNSSVVTLQKSLTASNLTGNLTITSGGILNTSSGSTAFQITGTLGSILTVGANSTLNVGGAGVAASSFPTGFTTTSLDPASTVQYSNSSSASQTVSDSPSYGSILFSGSGTKSLGAGGFTISGDWTNNSTGGSLNTGTSTVTLTGTAKAIGGSATTIFATLNVNGSYTNNGTNTVNAGLGGSGTLTLAASATLNIGFTGSIGLSNLVASASGNTVNYQYSGSQTVKAMNYTNLTLSGSGTKTLSSGTTGVSGTLVVSAVTVDATTNSSTVDFNGGGNQTAAATTYYNLTFSNAGTKFFPSGTTYLAGSLAVTGSASADATTNLSTIEFNGTGAQSVAGITYYSLTFTNAGLKTIGAPTIVNAGILVNAGANVLVTSTLQVTGDLINDGIFTNDGTITVN